MFAFCTASKSSTSISTGSSTTQQTKLIASDTNPSYSMAFFYGRPSRRDQNNIARLFETTQQTGEGIEMLNNRVTISQNGQAMTRGWLLFRFPFGFFWTNRNIGDDAKICKCASTRSATRTFVAYLDDLCSMPLLPLVASNSCRNLYANQHALRGMLRQA